MFKFKFIVNYYLHILYPSILFMPYEILSMTLFIDMVLNRKYNKDNKLNWRIL